MFGDEFGDEFGDKFGDHQIFVTTFGGSPNWVMILVTNFVTNLLIH